MIGKRSKFIKRCGSPTHACRKLERKEGKSTKWITATGMVLLLCQRRKILVACMLDLNLLLIFLLIFFRVKIHYYGFEDYIWFGKHNYSSKSWDFKKLHSLKGLTPLKEKLFLWMVSCTGSTLDMAWAMHGNPLLLTWEIEKRIHYWNV